MKNNPEPTIKDVLSVLGSMDIRFDRLESKIDKAEASLKAQIIESQDETAGLITDVMTLVDSRFKRLRSVPRKPRLI